MTGEAVPKSKLPPKVENNVVELNLRHVFLVFGGMIAAGVVSVSTIIIVRDYVRFRRQKAVIEAINQFLHTFNKTGGILWKEKKTDTSSLMKKSDRQEKS